MAQKQPKKENLPVKVDVDLSNGGTITYANEVIATIAGVAANEVDGVAGMSVSGGISDIWSRNKNITKGVKVEVGSQEAAVDLYLIVEYGQPIQKVGAEVQENVRKALESLTGLHVVRIDVHVTGVSFEMEKKANENLLEASKNLGLTEAEKAAEDDGPEAPAAPADEEEPDETILDDIAAENDSFDDEILEEQAQLEGTEEDALEELQREKAPDASPVQEEPLRSKKRPKVRIKA